MSEEEGIRQFVNQYGNLDPELENSFRKYITERDEPYYEAVNKRLLPSHLQDCINDGVCPNRGYTPTPPTSTQQAEMNRDKQEWGASSMISGTTLGYVGGILALGAGLNYIDNKFNKLFGNYDENYNRFFKQRQNEIQSDLTFLPFNNLDKKNILNDIVENAMRKRLATKTILGGVKGTIDRNIVDRMLIDEEKERLSREDQGFKIGRIGKGGLPTRTPLNIIETSSLVPQKGIGGLTKAQRIAKEAQRIRNLL